VLVAVGRLAAGIDVAASGLAFDEAMLPLVSEEGIEVGVLTADATDSMLDSTLDRDTTSERALPVGAAVTAVLSCDASDDA